MGKRGGGGGGAAITNGYKSINQANEKNYSCNLIKCYKYKHFYEHGND
jgi:hypothetical protein